jgi:MoaA/NifB/PqqE/SkfB family radical SAM enzyme
MNYKQRAMELQDVLLTGAKEILYRTTIPEIELYIGEDGDIHGRANGLIGLFLQDLIDKHTSKLRNFKVIAKVNGGNVYSLYHPPFPSVAGKRAIDARIRENVFHLRTPTTNTMAVTYRCMCKCVHCSADIKVNPNRNELTAADWKKVIDDCSRLGIYNHVFTGGEPLMRKDIPELIAHVTPQKGTTLMFSNGYLLKKRAKELADAGLYAVNISIDDINPKVHNELRRMENSFERAMEGARIAREYGILTGISTYATKEKIKNGDIEKLVEIATNEGFVEVTIFDPVPSGKWMRDTSCLLDEDDRKYLRDLTLQSRKTKDGPSVIAQSYINSPHGDGCFGGYLQLYTTAYGDVNPCDFNPVSFGNVLTDGGIAEIWYKMTHHPEYRHKRLHCRMQSEAYRKKYIDTVPDNVLWPIPIEYYEEDGKSESWDSHTKPTDFPKQIPQH